MTGAPLHLRTRGAHSPGDRLAQMLAEQTGDVGRPFRWENVTQRGDLDQPGGGDRRRQGPAVLARGVPSVAVDLSGHGLSSRSPQARWARPFSAGQFATEPSPVSGITTASAVATLIEQIRLIGNGEPCVVVAHSMAGVVATQAAELAPELFAHLVHVSAYAPITGSVIDYAALPEAADAGVTDLLTADPDVVGALRYDTGDPSRRSAFREVFSADVDIETADAAIGLLSSDAPLLPSLDRVTVTASRYGSIPHTYVVCTQDRAIPEALQRRFVRDIDEVCGAGTNVVTLETSHSPFLSQPAALADAILTSW
ncbi:alpha/beta hydrolase [Kineosporia sp. NBRC 101731]|uniref:alpha/beta fold hydrolase n=1 Tax=Kineosporia sp. NBRC 101731 TaxID=3032199 RepID=UPI0024A1D726|nr:alpha/beta hydrolase [Kineosporia sp. NBRC 101731]GLY29671.1 peptidase M13 [Kineosporia sp. NBRC 101731]